MSSCSSSTALYSSLASMSPDPSSSKAWKALSIAAFCLSVSAAIASSAGGRALSLHEMPSTSPLNFQSLPRSCCIRSWSDGAMTFLKRPRFVRTISFRYLTMTPTRSRAGPAVRRFPLKSRLSRVLLRLSIAVNSRQPSSAIELSAKLQFVSCVLVTSMSARALPASAPKILPSRLREVSETWLLSAVAIAIMPSSPIEFLPRLSVTREVFQKSVFAISKPLCSKR
mmetsp:Transcript_19757/g.48491  ORF Transcript_19757/g.48491 Transcript_19757/m.48491 type:complete len:226 (+) Transcript_19757:854-1531(+)